MTNQDLPLFALLFISGVIIMDYITHKLFCAYTLKTKKVICKCWDCVKPCDLIERYNKK